MDIRMLTPEDLPAAMAMVSRVFELFNASDYSLNGIEEFRRYINPEAVRERLGRSEWFAGAWEDERLVGVIAARDNHLSLLFVDPAYHRRGIAKALFAQLVDHCKAQEKPCRQIEVHASLYALPVYERLGFEQSGEVRVENGIVYIPMEYLMK